ncbi:MAG: Mth938-like domain-containing protein [Alphaproteobacteria bacterium]|nr:Mth938-like domain-containing protein [Alphaproteobacteria bacterium]
MDVTPLIPKGQKIIQAYKNGIFKISGVSYDGAVIVTPELCQEWNCKSEFAQLKIEDFAPVIEKSEEIDVFLFGTGCHIQFLPKALKTELKQNGVHVEIMDTGAACRTYNVLMAEGRRVMALLMPV